MGTWNAEVSGDDVALDIREVFLEPLANGEDGEQAGELMGFGFGSPQ